MEQFNTLKIKIITKEEINKGKKYSQHSLSMPQDNKMKIHLKNFSQAHTKKMKINESYISNPLANKICPRNQ